MIAKIYLVIVAAVYIGLAFWCTFSPESTSKKVGLRLEGGSGRSEFMTVYGGLELGIAIVLLLAVFRNETVTYGVIACVAIHGAVVLFRTISLLMFDNIDSFTWRLAIGEWAVLLLGLFVWYLIQSGKAETGIN